MYIEVYSILKKKNNSNLYKNITPKESATTKKLYEI